MKYHVEYLWAGEWRGHVDTYTYEEALAHMERMPKDRWPIRIRRGNELVALNQTEATLVTSKTPDALTVAGETHRTTEGK